MASVQPHDLRKQLAALILGRRSGHLGASNSVLDILWALHQSPGRWSIPNRDRLVLSKGHAAPILYLLASGDDGDGYPVSPDNFRRLGSPFEGHPRRHSLPYVDVTTGSLGNGLAFALGLSLADKRHEYAVLVSDGELQSGIAFEAIRQASVMRPTNLHVLVDVNGQQTSGPTAEVGGGCGWLAGFGDSFGEVASVNGHDVVEIQRRLALVHGEGPTITLFHTRRDFGMPYAHSKEIYGERVDPTIERTLKNWLDGGASQ